MRLDTNQPTNQLSNQVADLYGRKKVFAGGLLIYTIASLLCGLVRSAKRGSP